MSKRGLFEGQTFYITIFSSVVIITYACVCIESIHTVTIDTFGGKPCPPDEIVPCVGDKCPGEYIPHMMYICVNSNIILCLIHMS